VLPSDCDGIEIRKTFVLYIGRGGQKLKNLCCGYKELDGPAVSALRRAIAEVKQRWSVIGWVTKILSRAPPCFGRHFKPLVPAAIAVVSTHQPALGLCGWL
jgi:hypothetical protein